MTTITIALPEDRLAKLKELAERAGVAPEELLRANVEAWLARAPERSVREYLGSRKRA